MFNLKNLKFSIMKRVIYFGAIAIAMLFFSTKSYADITGPLTLNGHDALTAFYNGNTGLQVLNGDLILKGDITSADANLLPTRISRITGSIIMEDLTSTGDDAVRWDWLASIDWINETGETNGSLIVRNCMGLTWDSDKSLSLIKKVNGDFILDHAFDVPPPGADGWGSEQLYGNIEEVTGDFVLTGHGHIGPGWMIKLKKVGGDFKVYNLDNPWVWEPILSPLEEIGGDLLLDGLTTVLDDNDDPIYLSMWGLNFLKDVTNIGGDVTIVNFPKMTEVGYGEGTQSHSDAWIYFGYCFVKYLIDTGVIPVEDCPKVTLGWYGEDAYDLNTLHSCFTGVGVEGAKGHGGEVISGAGLGSAEPVPDCLNGTDIRGISPITTTARIHDNYLSIQCDGVLKKAELFDPAGKLAFTTKSNLVSIAPLPQGIYVVKITTSKGTHISKIVK
jgi:hypothetical protein